MFLFALVDVGIIASVFMPIPAAIALAGGIGLLVALVALLVHLSRKAPPAEREGVTSLESGTLPAAQTGDPKG